ncbi:DUF2520 domain-containing protein [uncultured Kriegella sp.]|uniref:Rossmann-like and DUF2520 domain-containing protein n=1 Tax=uncultured Kriegella sp. TaxID=1798910 RepID=UPI0030DB88A8|tara:strand:- start:41096 stop:41839 length:744 start_codon:yes stop_codon:yes gene_type:complete
MIKVTLVGTGNVSEHLKRVISKTDEIEVIQVLNSRSGQLEKSLETTGHQLPDIYIIAVSDDAITSVSKHFIHTKKLVVHTSGSVPMDVLPKQIRGGVLYPLQTFSKTENVAFEDIPLCIEAVRNEDLELLKKLAQILSNQVFEVSSEQRKYLHLAAVFVNNFTNHMYTMGAAICKEQQLPFTMLQPLIRETARKIESLHPKEAQTGPAKRNDTGTIYRHIELLNTKKDKTIYRLLSDSIKDSHGKEL